MRKQIEISAESVAGSSISAEGDILSTLRLVDHPNIVRLVTTYLHRGSYNLLFFPAECNLYQFLSQDRRMPEFETDTAFFVALQGISSALATLHEFYSPGFNISMIGCHHDLKPSNILIEKNRFLLADFGLSRLKPLNADSKTLFQGADSNYAAPECEFGEVIFERSLVGRKSDIWAFGCIISEVVTYMLMGSNGIRQFQEGRKAKVMNWTFSQFHQGGKSHPFVQSWISKLEKIAPSNFSVVFTLILQMLEIDPPKRPDAASVSSSLSLLAIRSQSHSLDEKMNTLSKSQAEAYTLAVEHERLRSWATNTGLDDPQANWDKFTSSLRTGVEFNDINQCFSALNAFLDTLNGWNYNELPFSPVLRQLRRHVDKLMGLLQQRLQDKITSAIEIQFLQNNNLDELERIPSDLSEASPLHNLRLLGVAKLMSASGANVASGLVERFEATQVNIQEVFDVRSSLAELKEPTDSDASVPVLIEWLEYDLQWVGDVGQELFARVEELASMLRHKEKPSGFLSLNCRGYYHNVQRHSFGLIFELPVSSSPYAKPYRPTTLRDMICKLRDIETRPFLGQIFELSHALAYSILQFHKANWLHENFSSFNVCFFPSHIEDAAKSITEPRLIGFNHSRQDGLDAFTHGMNAGSEQQDFSHPDYLKDNKGFNHTYDYYSIGLVLLEIGLWRTLESMASTMKDDDKSPESLRKFLLARYVPRLGNPVGEIYQKVVSTCLESDFSSNSSSPASHRIAILSEFEERVVIPLSRCRA